MPRSGEWKAFVLAAVAIAAGSILVTGQITVPNTFTNHTVADAPQVNANFNALAANALNRTGGTMTGTLTARDVTPSTDATYSLGTHALRFLNLATTGTTEFATHVYTWSAVQGTASQVLTNNGSDSLSWATPAAPNADNGIDDFRLSVSTGVPVPTSDVTAATTLYATPAGRGNRIALFDSGGTATIYTSAEFSIAVPATTSQLYTVMAFASGSTPTLELATWTNDTTPGPGACVLTTTGTWTKSGDLTRRCLGLMRTTTVSGQTEDSLTKRYVWNYHNRVRRQLARLETTASWPYTIATLRQANGSGSNQVDIVVGVAENPIEILVMASAENDTVASFSVGIGEDSTSAQASGVQVQAGWFSGATAPNKSGSTAHLAKMPAVGRHFYAWLEYSQAIGITTWRGNTDVNTTQTRSGISGWIEG